MLMRPAFTALLAIVAAGTLTAPAAGADEPGSYVIESANGTERVWHQAGEDRAPTITADPGDDDGQRWVFRSNRTIRNVATGLCATADGGRVIGAKCDRDDPGQRWRIRGAYNQKQLRNVETGLCATYEGDGAQVSLHTCDWDRVEQRWYLNA
ncbi:RICIN domain-containing protein [Crossiella sp. SN42]|uniref:ricin-type beta-trefoil lectin domain protein n=1 Tax=Crossiella sp. SN42 TaxID=2944808 RepID=UPI00207C81D8|nr:ricin-type beta-trefoil lectin domain protein [Crossiella sp. SN42]MCO1578469.1 RICIN domain-containing protein [Crossiella sp. SN42]